MTILNDISNLLNEIMVDIDNRQQALALAKKMGVQANVKRAAQLEDKQNILKQKIAGRQLARAGQQEAKNQQMQRMHKQLGF